ncbi:peptidase C1B, bleomycin hydrolase [Chlorella virus XW01]|nr:peptidase C1B, bleomycin hydrolase [Chlorella virus XW01]
MNFLSKDNINKWLQQPINTIQNSLNNDSVKKLGKQQNLTLNDLFNNQIQNEVKITDQHSSGRCWLFATCNLIRSLMLNNLPELKNFKDLELSESYLFFFDKLERYNRLLKYYLEIQKEKEKDRYLYQLLHDPLGDGGQFDMAGAIVKKYGIVPKSCYIDTYHAKNTDEMNEILKTQLINDIEELNVIPEHLLEETINLMVKRVYYMLVGFLGKPPTKFVWEFENDGKFYKWDMTPLEFLTKSQFNPDYYISVINDPRKEHPYNNLYQVKYLGNVEDNMVKWINLPMDRLLNLTQQMIDKKIPVWFGCDVGKEYDSKTGVHNLNLINYEMTGMAVKLTKEQKLRNKLALPNHAMLITGYHLDGDNITKWKVENSWGDDYGAKGYLIMSNEWMKEYTFQILVRKDFLTDEERELLVKTPLTIQPWDPLGTLAL